MMARKRKISSRPDVSLRWNGNIEAQQAADDAFNRLRDKPKKLTKKQRRKKQKKERGSQRLAAEIFVRPDYYEYIKSTAWRRRRRDFLERTGTKCTRCGSKSNIEVHHKTYKNLGRERDKELEALCADCHADQSMADAFGVAIDKPSHRANEEIEKKMDAFVLGKAALHAGDCREVMKTFADGYFHAIVTDPPYGLEFMGKDWDRLDVRQPGDEDFTPGSGPFSRAKVRHSASPAYGGAAGKQIEAWHEQWAAEAFRVLKPGGHLLAFSGARTYHRLASAIENVGFEIRDQIQWIYGSGFPKSRDVSKAIDEA